MKENDKVEWDHPDGTVDYGTVREVYNFGDDKYLDIRIDWCKKETMISAKMVNDAWMVYKSYHDYSIPLRLRKDK